MRICVARQMASRDPKFHQAEILEGAGRSIRELLIIFSRGWDLDWKASWDMNPESWEDTLDSLMGAC